MLPTLSIFCQTHLILLIYSSNDKPLNSLYIFVHCHYHDGNTNLFEIIKKRKFLQVYHKKCMVKNTTLKCLITWRPTTNCCSVKVLTLKIGSREIGISFFQYSLPVCKKQHSLQIDNEVVYFHFMKFLILEEHCLNLRRI